MTRRSGNPVGRPGKDKDIRFSEFSERLQSLAAKRGMVRKDLTRPYTEMNDGTLGNYWRGERLPIPRHAKAIADRLGVSVDYLVYGNEDKAPQEIRVQSAQHLTQEEIYILKNILKKLTSEE